MTAPTWRQRLAAAGVQRHQWEAVRRHVAASLPQPCTVCGDTVHPYQRWHLDHVVPLVKGGHPIDLANLGPAHANCNRRKGGLLHHASPPPTAPPSRPW